jgi:hypothetical protein
LEAGVTKVSDMPEELLNLAREQLSRVSTYLSVTDIVDDMKVSWLRRAFVIHAQQLGNLYATCKEGDYFEQYPHELDKARGVLRDTEFCLLLCKLFDVDVSDMAEGYSIMVAQIEHHLETGEVPTTTH